MSRLHDALDSCLAALRGGADLEACLGMYPDLADRLRPALEAAIAAMALSSEGTPAAAATRSRNLLLARAKEMGPRAQKRVPPIRIPRFALAGLTALLAVFLGGGGLLVASAAALPGDALYGLKRTAEDLRLRLVPPSARAGLEEQFNDRRTGEIRALFSLGRVTPVTFEGFLTSQTGDLWVVGDIPIHLGSETEVEGAIALGRIVEVSGMTEPGGAIRAQSIRLRGFELTGLVEEIDERDWVIEGEDVFVPSDAHVDPGIGPGARVVAQVRVDDDGEYVARSITLLGDSIATPVPAPAGTEEPEDEREQTDLEGTVESMSNSAWVVSGVRVLIDNETEIEGDPALGESVRVEGTLQADGTVLADRIRLLEGGETSEPEQTEPTPPSATQSPDGQDDEQADRVEFEGNVDSISPGLWLIDGQAVIVTSQTEIDGDPGVGDRVRVRATWAADGRLVAERIEVHD